MRKLLLVLVSIFLMSGGLNAPALTLNSDSPFVKHTVIGSPQKRYYNPGCYHCPHQGYYNPHYQNTRVYRSRNYNRYHRPVRRPMPGAYRYYHGSGQTEKNIKPVAFNFDNNLHYEKVSQIERSIWGKSYENQNINIRLNRLEKTVFNRTYLKMPYEQRVNNLIVNYNSALPKQISSDNIARLEERVFNRNYINDNEEGRISRLEEEIFGARQQGDIKSRYKKLKQASANYNSDLNACPYNRPYISTGTGGWRSMANSLGNFFFGGPGYPTGWTPQMDPAMMDAFESDRYNNSQDWVTNRGWYHNSNTSGSNAGVTILD